MTQSPIIMRPITSPPSSDKPPTKKPRIKSPKYTTRQPTQYFHVKMENEHPIHEKYGLQDVHDTSYKVIVKATRQPREDEEINIDLPAYFVYHRENKHWLLITGPTSNYDEPWYNDIEMLIGATGAQQTNTAIGMTFWSSLAWITLGKVEDHHYFGLCRQVSLVRPTLSSMRTRVRTPNRF